MNNINDKLKEGGPGPRVVWTPLNGLIAFVWSGKFGVN